MWYAERRELPQKAAKGPPMARARSLTEFQEAFPDEARCATFLFERGCLQARCAAFLFERRWLQVNPSRQRRRYRLMNLGRACPAAPALVPAATQGDARSNFERTCERTVCACLPNRT